MFSAIFFMIFEHKSIYVLYIVKFIGNFAIIKIKIKNLI